MDFTPRLPLHTSLWIFILICRPLKEILHGMAVAEGRRHEGRMTSALLMNQSAHGQSAREIAIRRVFHASSFYFRSRAANVSEGLVTILFTSLYMLGPTASLSINSDTLKDERGHQNCHFRAYLHCDRCSSCYA
jgi:hypothetical protein